MRFAKKVSLQMGWWLRVCLTWMAWVVATSAQSFTTTTVQGTVYLASGSAGSGVAQVSWPAFTTAANQAVAAGRLTVTIGSDGFLSVNLAPNQGATPAGLYYTVVYHLNDGSTSTEYWVVPAAAQAALGQVRAQVMPAAQAVQAVSKSYVDQSITELTQSLLTASGGDLTGPLFLSGDPSQPTQAATKHYVDQQAGKAVQLTGGVMSGPLTSVQLGAVYQADQFVGADFGAQVQACVNKLDAVYGGTCDARNFAGTQAMGADLVIATANVTVQLPCATIATANRFVIAAGTRNVTLHGCASRGASAASGSQGGTVLLYSGGGAAVQVGDATYAVDTLGFHLDNVVINTTAATNASAHALAALRTQELDLESLYLLGNANQTGLTLDGTGNYTGGTFKDDEFVGFGTAVNGIGHQIANAATTDWLNASTFVRLHIDCPTSGGSPLSGTYGINLQQGDGNTFTGGDIEGCGTALHLGANAQNNTLVGVRNENSRMQVVADAGSSYNNWMTGGTMFTGQLSDSGTRNSFLDTFHRSFNGLNGDWYGSQQDATVTNHFRIGIGSGSERGLLNRYQTDYGYRWTEGLSDATAGEQFYQLLDELNNVYRLSIGQYNHGQASSNNQTVINAAGTGAVVLNGSANAGTGGVIFGAGGGSGATVATINSAGNAQFNGSLQVGGPSTFVNSTTVRNGTDAEIDAFLWAGATANQKESFIYKDYTGTSQWYLVKDASNNWALNSAVGGLDSFKAYQSTNSGDTYVNAASGSGAVRVNYESGAGTQFKVYGGSSSALYASFSGTNAIQFPGLAAGSGKYCLQVDNSGYLSNTGGACGTVNSGSTGQIAFYNSNGSALSGVSSVPLSAGGTGATTATAALANIGAQAALGYTPVNKAGDTMTGQLSATSMVTSTTPMADIRNVSFAGGAVIDGATDISAALASATAQACTTSGVVYLSCTGSGCYLANGNNQQNNMTACATANHVQFKLQGKMQLGSTLNLPSPSTWTCDGGYMPGQFSYGQSHCKIIAPQVYGTLGTAVVAGTSQTFTPTFTSGSSANLIANSSAISVGETTTCNISSTLVNGTHITATLAANQCRIPAGVKATIAGTSRSELNTTPIILASDYPGGLISWNPSTKAWAANTAFNLGAIVADNTSNCAPQSGTVGLRQNCLQIATTAGTSGATNPGSGWNATPGGTTTDGTVVWTNYDQSTSAGGTITGFNDDTYENVRILTNASGVMTATFLHAHPSTALWGEVAISPIPASYTDMTLNGIEVSGCWGTCIWFEHAADVRMDGVAAQPNQYLAAGALELASTFNWHISHSAFLPVLNQGCFMNCAQTAYPCGVRITMANTTTDSTSFSTMDNWSYSGGCIKADANGRASSSGATLGQVFFDHMNVEQPNSGGLIIDPRGLSGSGVNSGFVLNGVALQDNANGYDPSTVYYTDPSPTATNPGQVLFNPLELNAIGHGYVVNPYANGHVIINGTFGVGHPVFPWRPYTPLGSLNDGITLEAELRGEGANLSPSIIPYATGNVTTNPASWSCFGTGCSVTTGIEAPDGTATAGEIVTGSNISPSVTVYTYTGATSAGDHFLTGVWCMSGTNTQPNQNCSSTAQGVPYVLSDSGSDQWDGTTSSTPTIASFTSDWRQDWWKPVVSDNKITSGSGTSHTIKMQLLGMNITGQGNRFWMPFVIYIPVSAKPSTMTTQQWDMEIARWRQQLLHGIVPPNMPAGVLAMNPAHKLYWGSDTNLYRSAAGVVHTDGSLDAGIGIMCSGTFGAPNQVLAMNATGNGCTWQSASAPQNAQAVAGKALTGYNSSNGTFTQASVGSIASYTPGDMVCAMGGDTTIGAVSITGGSSTGSTTTVTVASVPNYFYAGVPVVVAGAMPAGYNVTSATIIATTSTSITFSSTANPGAWSSGGTIALACANSADAIAFGSQYAFANNYPVGANSITAGSTYQVRAQFANFTSSAGSYGAGITMYLKYGSTSLWNYASGSISPASSETAVGGEFSWDITALSSSLLATTLQSQNYITGSWNGLKNGQTQPVPVTTTSANPFQLTAFFAATGVASGTYTSGGTTTGTTGQTCTLTGFNNSSTGTATVALTGTNTIAGATALTITSRGAGATAAPTTATLGNGTATCSGTATVSTVLGGSPGNGIVLYDLIRTQ